LYEKEKIVSFVGDCLALMMEIDRQWSLGQRFKFLHHEFFRVTFVSRFPFSIANFSDEGSLILGVSSA